MQIFFTRSDEMPASLSGTLFMLLENTVINVPNIVNGLGTLKPLPSDYQFTLTQCEHINFVEEFHQLRSGDEIPTVVRFCNDCQRCF